MHITQSTTLELLQLIDGSGASGIGTGVVWSYRANDIDVPWSARKVLKELKDDGNAADPCWYERVEREYKMPKPEQRKLSDKLRRHSKNLHDRKLQWKGKGKGATVPMQQE